MQGDGPPGLHTLQVAEKYFPIFGETVESFLVMKVRSKCGCIPPAYPMGGEL